jgi:hypothetical protein
MLIAKDLMRPTPRFRAQQIVCRLRRPLIQALYVVRRRWNRSRWEYHVRSIGGVLDYSWMPETYLRWVRPGERYDRC